LYPPKNLEFEITKDDEIFSVYLKWTASINSDVSGYVVYRKDKDDQMYTELARLDANSLSYIDEDLDPSTQYEYMLTTFKLDKESSEGSEIEVSIPSLDDDSVKSKSSTGFNAGSIFLTLFVIAGLIVLTVYLLIKFGPRIFKKKNLSKDPLSNILRDPALYEDNVSKVVDTTPLDLGVEENTIDNQDKDIQA
jgi:hypothetical protein